jgi:nucleotide-binding universal stress UspA family protein
LSGLEGMLLGSVTARVLRKAQCPVWVARVQPENGSEEAA